MTYDEKLKQIIGDLAHLAHALNTSSASAGQENAGKVQHAIELARQAFYRMGTGWADREWNGPLPGGAVVTEDDAATMDPAARTRGVMADPELQRVLGTFHGVALDVIGILDDAAQKREWPDRVKLERARVKAENMGRRV